MKRNTKEAGAQGALLQVNDFSVTFGSKTVLSDVSFTVPEKGIVVLTGPKGLERTTLLRTLAGYGAEGFSYKTTGTALYRGAVLGEKEHPVLVAQNAQLMMASVLENVVVKLPGRNRLTQALQRELAQKLLNEAGLQELCVCLDDKMVSLSLALQRHLSILREIVANPPLLCIDEPTSGLSDLEAARLIAYLRAESTRRALLVSVHNQIHARLLEGSAVLIAHGRVLEQQPISQIFGHPRSPAAIEFAQTGKCSAASIEASFTSAALIGYVDVTAPLAVDSLNVASDTQPAIETLNSKDQAVLGRFLWLKRGMLAGTPAPGMLSDMDSDLKALQQHGITALITLTETAPDQLKLQAFGFKSIWEPVPDQAAPSIEQAIRICKKIDILLEQGNVLAIQGHAGLGRTGTVLAAHLLWMGMDFQSALEYVRRVEPRWVQTREQEDFLREFAKRV